MHVSFMLTLKFNISAGLRPQEHDGGQISQNQVTVAEVNSRQIVHSGPHTRLQDHDYQDSPTQGKPVKCSASLQLNKHENIKSVFKAQNVQDRAPPYPTGSEGIYQSLIPTPLSNSTTSSEYQPLQLHTRHRDNRPPVPSKSVGLYENIQLKGISHPPRKVPKKVAL